MRKMSTNRYDGLAIYVKRNWFCSNQIQYIYVYGCTNQEVIRTINEESCICKSKKSLDLCVCACICVCLQWIEGKLN